MAEEPQQITKEPQQITKEVTTEPQRVTKEPQRVTTKNPKKVESRKKLVRGWLRAIVRREKRRNKQNWRLIELVSPI